LHFGGLLRRRQDRVDGPLGRQAATEKDQQLVIHHGWLAR
jgi:hypothetical protein